MKKLYFLLLAFSLFTTTNAQIVNIPDANFKVQLVVANPNNITAKNLSGVFFKIDANNDGQIQESEALNVSYLAVSNSNPIITSLVGIEKFINLKVLNCSGNQITKLDVSGITNLQFLNCSYNLLTSLNTVGLKDLQTLNCEINLLVSLNLTGLTALKSLLFGVNQLSTIDLTSSISLESLSCFYNQLTALDISSLKNLKSLTCGGNLFTDLNLNGSINLEYLNCNFRKFLFLSDIYASNIPNNFNKLTNIDLTGLIKLNILEYSNNQISNLDVSGLTNLKDLSCSSNQIATLDVSRLTKLQTLDCSYNQIALLDVSQIKGLYNLYCSSNQITTLDVKSRWFRNYDFSNNQLESLLIKNGVNNTGVLFSGNPNLKYICVDDFEQVDIQKEVTSYGYTNCQVNSYCSFVPGGGFYTIQGNQKLDSNKNGCDANDIVMSNLKYTVASSTTTGSIISDTSGNYSIPVQAGTHTITPVLEYPNYYIVSPTSVNVTFPTQISPITQNFCVTPNGAKPDLEVSLLPLAPPRPGFDAKYKLVYKNKGNTFQSGSVNLSFNDAVLDLVVANPIATNQTTNNLSWNFTALKPFETREISFTMNVNSPQEIPAVINGDILAYTATITSAVVDETPTDNTFTFNQTVVGSYDPNDKTCLEGSVITPALIGQYVHYTIRFENTGTFAAENVVIKDMIDLTKFDVSTLVPTSASHSYTTKISEGNKVEFIFENINLPFDDANNDGYIAFKIKTKSTLVVNDTFSNEANIYFDYNFPILTNKATSTFKTLGTPDFDFTRYFTVYPNPVKADLNITAKETINVQSMRVYNTLGQLVLALPNAAKVSTIDVSSLTTGNYFLQIKTDKGSSSAQFVKE